MQISYLSKQGSKIQSQTTQNEGKKTDKYIIRNEGLATFKIIQKHKSKQNRVE